MKERGILFSGDMVRALRDGRKTQTRRTRGLDGINEGPNDTELLGISEYGARFKLLLSGNIVTVKCPYGVAGDLLYVRETWCPCLCEERCREHIAYRATDQLPPESKWKPPIFMPRWVARDWLRIVSVRPERVQYISGIDAVAEGCGQQFAEYELMHYGGYKKARQEFRELWDSIHGAGAWERSDWVWRIEYERISKQ